MGKVFHEGGRKSERIFTLVEENLQQKYMHEAGFFDITVKDIKCPFGAWSQDKKQKELGMSARLTLEADIEGVFTPRQGLIMVYLLTRLGRIDSLHVQRRHELESNRDSSVYWLPSEPTQG